MKYFRNVFAEQSITVKYLCRAEKGGVKYPANCEQPTLGLSVTLNKALGLAMDNGMGLGVLCNSVAVLCQSIAVLC